MSNWYQNPPLPPLSTVVGGHFYGALPPIMSYGPTGPRPGGPPLTQSPPKRGKKPSRDNEVTFPINFPVYSVSLAGPIDERQLKLLPDQIKTLRYATRIDDRNFITVYEYSIGDHPIIWDYFTGYVHLTGIWKALGNSKADIVRLLDGSPELEQVFKRVRGGFLKIQGTWVAYDVARSISLRFCYPIRYALIPVFGPDFPAQCLEPHETGYGKLALKSAPGSSTAKQSHLKQKTKPGKPGRRSTIERKKPLAPYNRKARTQSTPYRKKLWEGMESQEYAIDSSEEESDGLPNSPPPMPRKLSFVGAEQVVSSPPQFLEMLQATRLLQQLSTGGQWGSSVGGNFEVEGCARRYVWDGGEKLEES